MISCRARGLLASLVLLAACGEGAPPADVSAPAVARPLSAEGALELLEEVRGEEGSAAPGEQAAVSTAPAPGSASVVFAARLIDEQFRPLPGGSLALTRPGEQGREEVARAQADTNGSVWLRVALSELPGERSVLLAQAPGHAHASITADPPRADTGGIVGLGELVLPAGGELRGRIVDLDGAALAGARVLLLAEDSASVGVSVTAGADGAFALRVPLGRRWILEARDPQGRFEPVQSAPLLGDTQVVLAFSAAAR
jgi:hypothetical protein